MNEYKNLSTQCIYLIREREFIMTNQEIYKFGKSKQEGLNRFHNYTKVSELIIQLQVINCDLI